METYFYDILTKHCSEFSIFKSAQHGFRKNHSTISNLLELFNDITAYINSNNSVDMITVDVSKAFDTISHNKLLIKLYSYGICGKILGWIKNFLTDSSFNEVSNNFNARNYPVTSSVPQGSKLGPLLYILYANGLVDNFKFANIKMYADDLTIYAKIRIEGDKKKIQ